MDGAIYFLNKIKHIIINWMILIQWYGKRLVTVFHYMSLKIIHVNGWHFRIFYTFFRLLFLRSNKIDDCFVTDITALIPPGSEKLLKFADYILEVHVKGDSRYLRHYGLDVLLPLYEQPMHAKVFIRSSIAYFIDLIIISIHFLKP